MSEYATYCSVVLLLRQLIQKGLCTQGEAKRIAARYAKESNIEANISL